MYLRQSPKWNEFLLAESSQPAVLLTEITYASAVNNLSSKKTKKTVYQWLLAGGWISGSAGPAPPDEPPEDFSALPEDAKIIIMHAYMKRFKQEILRLVPQDLEDNQKGLAVTWLNRQARQDPNFFGLVLLGGSTQSMGTEDLEMFFHYQQFMGKKDLNTIKDLDELEQIVLDARDDIRDYQESRAYKDADAPGAQEVFRDDEEWKIVAIHNKGAACQLGKGTNWCTAAPGLDYFEDYYKPEDPLFYFEQRSDEEPGSRGEKFQFHYGTEQFMTADDQEVSGYWGDKLHKLLMQTEAPAKYPIVKKFERKLILSGKDTTPEILEKMSSEEDIEYLELMNIAEHPNVGPETLQKLVKVRNPSRDYIDGVGKNDYGVGLKEQIARSKSATPEVLDELLEDASAAYNAMVKDSMQRIQASHEKWKKEGPTPPGYYGGPEGPELDERWATRAKSLRLLKLQDYFKPVFTRAIANKNISNKRLETMLEDDLFGQLPPELTRFVLDAPMGAVPLARMIKEKLAGRRDGEELGYVDIRRRMIRRRNPKTAAKLPPLDESRILQRWQQIIK